ncbi:antigen 5 like allergen Cul n 1-like [Condylostylus longicornis]|uniref:antigen 5 like allergen Cul n 1-like n=1 Tax=Condylostylus longicornis TaxID=2530218 RepID=UPI00244E26B4|nr:antigen 5 like allergen Cul n 1-like [Condylostylus longicornis]
MIKLIKIFTVIFTITLIISESKNEQIDWCDKDKWCDYILEGQHIKCNNTGKFSSDCPEEVQMIPINKAMRMEILYAHNKYRNLIASGKLPNYKPARRMAQMCYCHDLARMAELNVKTCRHEHDKCRSTEKYHFSGQNLFRWYSNMKPKNIKKILLSGITDWFDEYKLTDMSIIDKYHRVKEKVGHFTALVTESNRCVGCSALKMFKDGFYEILFACNYASTNIRDRAVYKTGKPGSKCKSGRSKKYPALCNNKEIYDLLYEEDEDDSLNEI